MIFDDWSGVVRVLALGACAYFVLVAILRISGKRTLSKLNAFDFVVTVALGSTLATILLSKSVALAEGVAGFLVLVLLQYVIAALSARFRIMEAVAKSDPVALLIDGAIDDRALRQQRVTRKEVLAAVRGAGIGDLSTVAVVVLETDGTFSVIANDRAGNRSAMPNASDKKQ